MDVFCYNAEVPAEIDRREVLHYLGWHGEALDAAVMGQIEHAEAELRQLRPRVLYRFFPYEPNRLAGTGMEPAGQAVQELLRECHEAVLLAVTLGEQADRMIRRAMLVNAGSGMVMDAVASSLVEELCNKAEEEIHTKAGEKLFLTDRFSPGYGDMPLTQCGEICRILETEKRIGLTVSRGGLMVPQKSVTAILGISDRPQKHRPSPCEVCGARDTCQMARSSWAVGSRG